MDARINSNRKILALHAQRDHSLLPIYLEVLCNLDVETESWETPKDNFDFWVRTVLGGSNRFDVLKRLEWLSNNSLIEFYQSSKDVLKGVRNAIKPHGSTRDLTNKQTNKTPLTPQGGSDRFEEFWLAYPKSPNKKAKSAVKRQWERQKLDKQADAIINAAMRYAATEGCQKEGGKYVVKPSRFLNEKTWEDGDDDNLTLPSESPADKKRRKLLALLEHARLKNRFDGQEVETSELEYREPFLHYKANGQRFSSDEWEPIADAG